MGCVCGRRHLVVFMTFLGMLISTGSRGVFTMVITHLLGIDTSEEGLLKMTCYNNTYTYFHQTWPSQYVFQFQTFYYVGIFFTQLPGGILAARFSPKRVSGVATLLTSVLTIATRFALQYQPWLVFVIRILQGLIEGVIVPSFYGVIADLAPRRDMSVLITIAYSGAYLSPAVAAITSGMLLCKVSWGSSLFVYGAVGIVWSVVWLCCIHDSPLACPGISDEERNLFRGHPPRTVSRPKIGLWSALLHIIMTVVVISGGITIDDLIENSIVSKTVAGENAHTIGFGAVSVCLLVLGHVHHLEPEVAIVILCVGVAISGIAISGYQVDPLDFGPRYVPVLTGITRLGTIGSVISTVIAVKLPGKTHDAKDWRLVFLIAGSLHLAGVLYYLIFASGKRQPCTRDNPQPDISHGSDDENNPLLSRSMPNERIADFSDEFEGPSCRAEVHYNDTPMNL